MKKGAFICFIYDETMTNIIYDFACSKQMRCGVSGTCEIINNICHSFIINESYKCTCLDACVQKCLRMCIQTGTFIWFIYDETMTNLIYDFACSKQMQRGVSRTCEIINNICHSFIINESYKCTCLDASVQTFFHTCI